MNPTIYINTLQHFNQQLSHHFQHTHARTHTRAPHAYTPHRRAGARAPTHTHHMHTHTPHARAGTHTRTHARTHTEERPSQSRGEKKGLEGRFKWWSVQWFPHTWACFHTQWLDRQQLHYDFGIILTEMVTRAAVSPKLCMLPYIEACQATVLRLRDRAILGDWNGQSMRATVSPKPSMLSHTETCQAAALRLQD